MSNQDKYRDPNPVVRSVLRRFFARVRTALAETGAQSVLDVGCGEGELLRRGVLPPAVRAVHVDLRLEPLLEFRAAAPGSLLVRAAAQSLPFPDRSFDAVLCLEVLEHLERPAEVLRELSRVARRGIVLSVPWEPWFRIGNVLRGKHLAAWGNHPEHIQHWDFRTFRPLLESSLGEVRLMGAFPWMVAACRPAVQLR